MAWFFEDDVPGKWTKFDANGEKEVEKDFQKGHPTVQSSFFNQRLRQNVVYHYNLDAMQQVNMTTGYIRRIKRELPVGAGSAPRPPLLPPDPARNKREIPVGAGGPELAGVGIFLQQEPTSGRVYVVNIVEKGSADRSGVIRVNDVIVKVDDEDVQEFDEAAQSDLRQAGLIRGAGVSAHDGHRALLLCCGADAGHARVL
jgi:C-terminal processing protease CtpA/Prc